MTTVVHFECRNPDHHRGTSRRGAGGLVIHHGSVGYCDGVNVDGAHRWIATGGVPLEFLYDTTPAIDGPGTYRGDDGTLVHVRASATGQFVIEVDGDPRTSRGDSRIGAKLSDDPDWPDRMLTSVAVLSAD